MVMLRYGVKAVKSQKGKNYRQVRAEVQTNPIPSRRFSHIHVDIVGPLPCLNGFSHIFTIIDRPTH